ncbi:hypothetical protein EVAR_19951_1 [Eumeta japonica]|uniref:Uncharacterized protein n=1 Tax=Eumeta variegata TaxID=151549 RepID=A0A4C1YKC5_EUMVA|nr:hypothetical protein EVAR_19951_1 [Eumeta japonica]
MQAAIANGGEGPPAAEPPAGARRIPMFAYLIQALSLPGSPCRRPVCTRSPINWRSLECGLNFGTSLCQPMSIHDRSLVFNFVNGYCKSR